MASAAGKFAGPDGLLCPTADKQKQLWQALFSKPWEWWDNRSGKGKSSSPDFRHKASMEPLWLDDQHKPLWVDARIHALDDWLKPQHVRLQEGQGLCEQIRTLCEGGHLDKALTVLRLHSGTLPISRDVYICLLKECRKPNALHHAKYIHAHLSQHMLQISGLLGDSLVSGLAKCGALDDARYILLSLEHRTVNTWTTIITAYTTFGHGENALEMHQYMQEDGVEPNQYTYVSLFKACAIIPNLCEAEKLHAAAQRTGFTSHAFVGNTLVRMYGKCGNIRKAEGVFDELLKPDVVSWSALLSAYVDLDCGEKALQAFKQMQEEGVTPDHQTFAMALHACSTLIGRDKGKNEEAKTRSLGIGQALHADATREGLMSDTFLSNALVDLYGKCGSIVEAEDVFNHICNHDTVSWNSMLSAYVEQGQVETALLLYRQMLEAHFSSDQQTFVITVHASHMLVMKAEALVGEPERIKRIFLEIGQSLHANALKAMYMSNSFVCNTLVSLYGRCGSILEAENVFEALSKRDVVSWSAMLSAYVEEGQGKKALLLYRQMQQEGVSPDEQAFAIALQACVGSLGEVVEELEPNQVIFLEIGQALHTDAWEGKGFRADVFVGSSLMNMYNKYGRVADAENVFLGLFWHNTLSWNVMLSTYVDHSRGEEALHLYVQMKDEGVPVDDTTIMFALEACRETGWLEMCKQVHFVSVFAGYDLDPYVGNTLVRVYGSCASMADALAVFDGLFQCTLISWNSCISGHAQEGNSGATLKVANEMQSAGILPDVVTFVSLLCVCNHAGLVHEGIQYFESMSRDYSARPDVKHYMLLIDLLGRAGEFRKIESVLGEMPVHTDLAFWSCLLAACRTHGNMQLAKQAFERAVCLKPKDPAAYVLMSNIFANAGLQEHADEIERLRQKEGAWTHPIEWWIKHDGEVYPSAIEHPMHTQRNISEVCCAQKACLE